MSENSNSLTKTQRDYLQTIIDYGRLTKGWGGYSSTLTVRLLEEKGLIRLQRYPRPGQSESWVASPRVQEIPQ